MYIGYEINNMNDIDTNKDKTHLRVHMYNKFIMFLYICSDY